MNKRTATFLYVFLIIALILFLCWMIFWLRSESSSCVRNPIKYFREKNPEIECRCSKDGIIIEELSDEFKIQPFENGKV